MAPPSFRVSFFDRSSSSKGKKVGFEANALGFHDKYYLGDKLGKGGFGCVYSAVKAERSKGGCPNTDIDQAVKIVDLRFANAKYKKVLQNEVDIWSNLKRQPNCVALHESFLSDGLNYMVMERCQSLLPYLESRNDVQERFLGEMFAQMLMGIKHLHSANVIHRDIKPDNFFVGGASGHTIKLGDFGLAIAAQPGCKVKGECGTAPFMAPEMLANEAYDAKADIWSFGVLVYVFLFGRFPYNPSPNKANATMMKKAIRDGKKSPDFGSYIPLGGRPIAFTMSLLNRNPDLRPSAAEAMRKEYMFAVLTDSYEVGEDLPSLRPVLRLVRKAHVFENRPLVRDELDEVLGDLQMKHLGRPITETSWTAKRSWDRRRNAPADGDYGTASGSTRLPSSPSSRGTSTRTLNSKAIREDTCTSRGTSFRSVNSLPISEDSFVDDDAFDNKGACYCDV